MTVLVGDCLAVMPTLDAESVDAIVCDPPYGLSFMGKAWDHGVPGVEFWREGLRVAKPGAHLVAFGGTRTYHRLTCAIEDAGWEIRDCLSWLYGSGFPKSLDVSKAIDKAAGAERERIGVRRGAGMSGSVGAAGTFRDDAWTPAGPDLPLTAPATDAAKQWDGWGTALKPAWEPIILARKPLVGTVAANVQEHGTGALNIDGCRIAGENPSIARRAGSVAHLSDRPASETEAEGRLVSRQSPEAYRAERPGEALGRWPANVVLDEDAAALLDAQAPEAGGGDNRGFRGGRRSGFGDVGAGVSHDSNPCGALYSDAGGASRFFYTAKAARSERNAGLDGLPARKVHGPSGDGRVWDIPGSKSTARANHHPTVKPLALMQWLCRLVTPKGGLILDPFCGSGSTGRAAVAEGFSFIGIELSEEYAEIARARIAEYAPLFNGAA